MGTEKRPKGAEIFWNTLLYACFGRAKRADNCFRCFLGARSAPKKILGVFGRAKRAEKLS